MRPTGIEYYDGRQGEGYVYSKPNWGTFRLVRWPEAEKRSTPENRTYQMFDRETGELLGGTTYNPAERTLEFWA